MMLEPIGLELDGMRKNLLRQSTPRRVFFFEHGEADAVTDALDRRLGLSAELDRNDDHFVEKRDLSLRED